MDGEATHLLLGPHRDFIGLIKKQNLFTFQLSNFANLVSRWKLMKKNPTDETQQEREIAPVETRRIVKSEWEMERQTIQFFYLETYTENKNQECSFERGSCPSLAIVENITPGALMMWQVPENNTFQMHWSRTYSAFVQVSQTVTWYSLWRNNFCVHPCLCTHTYRH